MGRKVKMNQSRCVGMMFTCGCGWSRTAHDVEMRKLKKRHAKHCQVMTDEQKHAMLTDEFDPGSRAGRARASVEGAQYQSDGRAYSFAQPTGPYAPKNAPLGGGASAGTSAGAGAEMEVLRLEDYDFPEGTFEPGVKYVLVKMGDEVILFSY